MHEGVPISALTNFKLASLSKQFVSHAFSKLEAKGKLSLDNHVTEYVSLPPRMKEITLYHILNHTSGIPDYFRILKDKPSQLSSSTNDSIVRMARKTVLDFAPGQTFQYSNSGYVLAWEVLREIVGDNPTSWFEKKIFRPAGMIHTCFSTGRDVKIPHRAIGYSHRKGKWIEDDATNYTLGDGGVYSSMGDMIQWAKHLDTLPRDRKNGGKYSLGWFFRQSSKGPIFYHTGSEAGFHSFFLRIPEERYSILLFSNANPSGKVLLSKVLPFRGEMPNL
jgi:CubicO group peptidase (beta-lactamase class C family)